MFNYLSISNDLRLFCTYAATVILNLVSKNPNGECNPQLGDDSIENIIVGIAVAIISILWTSYSTTAHKAVREERYVINIRLFVIFIS